MSIRTTAASITLLSLLTTAAAVRAQHLDVRSSKEVLGRPFAFVVQQISEEKNPERQQHLVTQFAEQLSRYGRAIVEDTTVFFVYIGRATHVSVPGDLNGWSPTADTMKRIGTTDFFYLEKPAPLAARFEYKFVVDSTWMLDPFNKRVAIGGYGPNSEVWMPTYQPPTEILPRTSVPHGTIDTLLFTSAVLQRTHPVMIYLPPGYGDGHQSYPVIFVTDGGEYLSLALMNNVIDNLIADRQITPVIGIFVDPRTDVRASSTSKRTIDYSLNDGYVDFLTQELRPYLLEKYRITGDPSQTAIMGSSLGGLISTYAAYKRPDVFGMAAAQSPAYWWQKGAILDTLEHGARQPVKFYIDTGTIHDAQEHASRMKAILEHKGYEVSYAEHPEGHNWVNWRARVPAILRWFRGTAQ